jgi:uncharacterized protein (TIGR03435 family)
LDDIELLREFASRNSEEAFRALVERHIDFVYATALRQLRDTHAAEEVTQAVFIDLARKAAIIPPGTVLSGWLFRAARFSAANTARTELRRKRREWEALQMEPTAHENKMDSPWEQMEPMLNDAIEQLSEKDRSAVLLRFFEKKPLCEVGECLGLNEEAAKKRVARAVDKLRLIFQRRGIATTSVVLMATLAAQTTQAAPIGLTTSIATNAALHGTALTASTVTIGKGILNIMAISKLKAAVVATAALLLVGGPTAYVVVQQIRARPQPAPAVVESVDDALALGIINSMNSQTLDTAPPIVFLRAHEPHPSDQTAAIAAGGGKIMGKSASIQDLLATAYGTTQSRVRMDGPAWPDVRVDYLVSLGSGQKRELQRIIREKLGLTAHRENRLEDVYVLTARAGEFPGRQSSVRRAGGSSSRSGDGELNFQNATIDSLARHIESRLRRPVINETGLRDRFDIVLSWGAPGEPRPGPEALKKAITDRLGLELKPEQRDVEILLVQKEKKP